jgi:hypothetical protein
LSGQKNRHALFDHVQHEVRRFQTVLEIIFGHLACQDLVQVSRSPSATNAGNPEKTPPTLGQIGIDKSKAKRLHRWTGISSQELERRIEEKREKGASLPKLRCLAIPGHQKGVEGLSAFTEPS